MKAEIIISKNEPMEYYCYTCGQLRLSFHKKITECLNCHSTDIRIGIVGELDKNQLKGVKNEN